MCSCMVQRQELLSAVNWELRHLSQQWSKLSAAYVATFSRFKDARAVIWLVLYWNIFF